MRGGKEVVNEVTVCPGYGEGCRGLLETARKGGLYPGGGGWLQAEGGYLGDDAGTGGAEIVRESCL